MAVRDGDGDSVRKQLEKGVDVNQELEVNMLMRVCTYSMNKEMTKWEVHATPFFSRENYELPQAGFEPTMFCILGRHSTN